MEPRTEDSRQAASLWKAKVESAFRRDKKWADKATKIVKRYRDDRGQDGPRKFNILWSNVETLKPALYSKLPVPICERRFLDPDPVGRAAAMILERALRYEVEDNGLDDALSRCVLDVLLPGRGVAWVRFEPEFGESLSLKQVGDDELSDEHDGLGEGVEEAEEEEAEDLDDMPPALVGASTAVDYVHWRDFTHSDARTWGEVEWIAKRVYMSRDALIRRFGAEVGKEIPLDHSEEDMAERRRQTTGQSEDAKATLFEIWCKYDKKVIFVSVGYEDIIEEVDDPLGLEGFWPIPRPLFATMTNETLEPVPDYVEYQDQAQELDSLTARIALLQKSLKVTGVYDSSAPGIKRMLQEGSENQLIPVDRWAAFAEKGGIDGAVSWLPIKDVAAVLAGLYESRERVKQDLYEITGIADIVRGSSDPNETLGAQQIKGRFAGQRINARQKEVARFARDLIAIIGEVICEHFPPQRIVEISSAMYDQGIGSALQPNGEAPPQMGMGAGGPAQGGLPAGLPPMAQPDPLAARAEAIARALQLLKDEKHRGFRIDIETDSTVSVDAEVDKQGATQFITASSQFLREAVTVGQQFPAIIPLLSKMLLFGVRHFRAGRDLENSFEEFADRAQQMAAQPKDQGPTPEQLQAQTEMMKARAEADRSAVDLQMKQMDLRMKEIELQQRQLDFQAKQLEMGQGERQKVSESIAFKDLPPEGQAQMAAQAGIVLHPAVLAQHAQDQAAQQAAMKRPPNNFGGGAPNA